MPVYIRKNVSFTPPSLYNMRIEEDSDYLLDPDQMRDNLPQPYRMIDKILIQIIDDAWEIVDNKEKALLAEARKIRPPCFNKPKELSIFDNATSLCGSDDHKYIFLGLPNGVAVMDALTQSELHKWEDQNAEITSINSFLLSTNHHLVTTVDIMGIARVFLFAFNHIFSVKTLNENAVESASKILCQKCLASQEADYIGAVFENTSNKEVWLEVHKNPLEAWIKELEGIGNAVTKQKEEAEKASAEATETVQEDGEPSTIVPPPTDQQKNPQLPDENAMMDSVIQKLGAKFSQPSLVLKVKNPQVYPLPANTSSSIASALSKIDQGDILGTGNSHILSAANLETCDSMFKHRNESMINYLPKEEEETLMSTTFHFVNASRMIPLGLDQPLGLNRPVAIVVWWSGTPHLYQYSLLKTGKDTEFKPDVVWPFTSNITCSAVSSCTSYIVLGLENGNAVLWERQLGLLKAVMNVSDESALKSVRFLNPCLFPVDVPHYPPYPTRSATFVLAECCDGTQSLYDTCDGSQQIPQCITNVPETDDEIQTLLRDIPKLPELMVYTQKNGQMFIKDIGTGSAICQLDLPPAYSISTPWDPVFAIGGGGQILYLKGEGTEVLEDGETKNISCLFMFHLRSYPILDSYWARIRQPTELTVFTTHEQRVEALMKERMQQQALRKPRMHKRWAQLQSELDIIDHARAVPVNTLQLDF